MLSRMWSCSALSASFISQLVCAYSAYLPPFLGRLPTSVHVSVPALIMWSVCTDPVTSLCRSCDQSVLIMWPDCTDHVINTDWSCDRTVLTLPNLNPGPNPSLNPLWTNPNPRKELVDVNQQITWMWLNALYITCLATTDPTVRDLIWTRVYSLGLGTFEWCGCVSKQHARILNTFEHDTLESVLVQGLYIAVV